MAKKKQKEKQPNPSDTAVQANDLEDELAALMGDDDDDDSTIQPPNKTEEPAEELDDIEEEVEDEDEQEEVVEERPKKKKKLLFRKEKKELDETPVKKKKKATSPREGLGDELIEVYEASGDDLSSVTTLEHRRRSWQRMLFWILLFLVAVFVCVALVSWLIWGGRQEFTGEQVEFDITVSEEITSGSEVVYAIQYSNHESVNFRKSEIELRYPSGFIFESAEPAPQSNDNLWDLGALNPGQDGEILVTGRLVGNPEIESTISGVMRYWPANFSSEFQEVASAQTFLTPIAVDLRFDGPEQVLVGQPTTYSMVLKNDTEIDYQNLRISFFAPEDFVVDELVPESENDALEWDIESLLAEEEQEFLVSGYFSAVTNETTEIIALLSQQGPEEDEYFDQKEQSIETTLIEGDLVLNLIANGSSRDATAQWGDQLNVTLSYQNSSETELADMTIVTKIESRYRSQSAEASADGALDFDKLVDANRGAVKVVDGEDGQSLHVRTITWDGGDVDTLESLEANEEGELNFQIPLFSADEILDSLNHPGDVDIILSSEVTIGRTGEVEDEVVVTSNQVKLSLNSDLTLDAHARYFADNEEELGSGPLPPQVGQETTYRVFIDLSNRIHEVQELILSGPLASNVKWADEYEVSAGEFEYSETNNEFTWRLNKLPLDVENVELNFALTLTPSDTQVDKVANLTKKMTLTAKDSVTGGKIILTAQPLTTGVDRDPIASDKGLVVE